MRLARRGRALPVARTVVVSEVKGTPETAVAMALAKVMDLGLEVAAAMVQAHTAMVVAVAKEGVAVVMASLVAAR